MTDRPRISGVVIAMNEERGIARCLASLSFCDEIVLVDSGSTDRTRELAADYTDRVIRQDFLGYVKQKNFALEQAKSDWVVCLDADEALDDTLRDAIEEAVATAAEDVAGFRVSRVAHYLGVWHEFGEWADDWQLRVFRRSAGGWTGRDPHDRVSVAGRVETLPGTLLHWNYADLAEHIQTIDRFSAVQARAMHEEGVRFRLRDLLLRPGFRFVKGFLLEQGFRMGLPGFLVSVSTAYYVFMKYAKLWELERGKE